ncbi:MAG: ribonuclease P protein component [Anaerolineaceae bacterium]
MKRKFRLNRFTDFKRVRRLGKSYAHPLVLLIASPNQLPQVRVGIITSRALGNAVTRNRIRRRLRVCMDERLPSLTPGWDLLLIGRQAIGTADFSQIQGAVGGLLERAGFVDVEHNADTAAS